MNEMELKSLWQANNEKLAQILVINKANAEDITRIKVHRFLGSMKPIKIFTVLVGVLWVGFGISVLSSIYFNSFWLANKFFLFSATIQVLLTAIALLIYFYQLIKIYHVEMFDSIFQTQKTLAKLKISTLWATRILILQLPVWTTFWWNETMLANWNLWQWTITVLVTLVFTFVALWLFFNIKYENRHKKWFNFIFNGQEWTPLIKSMDLLEQVDEYKG
jgi:hypothetical protein